MKKHHRRMTLDELANVKDEDIDFSDIPELDDHFWQNAALIEPDKKKSVTLRVKGSVLDYFKAGGKGYQTKINQVLESYIRSQTNSKSI
jgi:uncharacterized protein (DUF4415 family)